MAVRSVSTTPQPYSREQVARHVATVLLVAFVVVAGITLMPARDPGAATVKAERNLQPALAADQPLRPRIADQPLEPLAPAAQPTPARPQPERQPAEGQVAAAPESQPAPATAPDQPVAEVPSQGQPDQPLPPQQPSGEVTGVPAGAAAPASQGSAPDGSQPTIYSHDASIPAGNQTLIQTPGESYITVDGSQTRYYIDQNMNVVHSGLPGSEQTLAAQQPAYELTADQQALTDAYNSLPVLTITKEELNAPLKPVTKGRFARGGK